MNIFLQIFLYIDVFVIGVAAALAVRHGREHLKTKKELKVVSPHPANEVIPKEIKQRLIEESEEKYRHILDQSSTRLTKELDETVERINKTVKNLAADIITKELEGFEKLFQDYKDKADKELEGTKAQTDQYHNELKLKLDEEAKQERQRLHELIDNKLADVVMSFLLEAMQHEVDLGAQTDYLMKQLEDHKEEFKQAVSV